MKRYHNTCCHGELQISGLPYLSGPQNEDQIPEEIKNIFDKNPNVYRISIEMKDKTDTTVVGSEIFTRMKNE